MDLSSLKIINSRAIDLTKINAVVDDSPDERKFMTVCGGRPDKIMTVM